MDKYSLYLQRVNRYIDQNKYSKLKKALKKIPKNFLYTDVEYLFEIISKNKCSPATICTINRCNSQFW